MKPELVNFTVNGESNHLLIAPNELLLNVLRDKLYLTGTKYVCGIGECGACSVFIDGVLTLSCLRLAATVEGCDVTTIEGLRQQDGTLDPVQEAFLDHGAYQCGYCTPGLIIASKALLAENPSPSEPEIQEYLRGNLCRCTGYSSIVRAVQGVVAKREYTVSSKQ